MSWSDKLRPQYTCIVGHDLKQWVVPLSSHYQSGLPAKRLLLQQLRRFASFPVFEDQHPQCQNSILHTFVVLGFTDFGWSKDPALQLDLCSSPKKTKFLKSVSDVKFGEDCHAAMQHIRSW